MVSEHETVEKSWMILRMKNAFLMHLKKNKNVTIFYLRASTGGVPGISWYCWILSSRVSPYKQLLPIIMVNFESSQEKCDSIRSETQTYSWLSFLVNSCHNLFLVTRGGTGTGLPANHTTGTVPVQSLKCNRKLRHTIPIGTRQRRL